MTSPELPDEVQAFLNSSVSSDIIALFRAALKLRGPETFENAYRAARESDEDDGDDVFARGWVTVAEMPESEPVPVLWFGVYPGHVTYFVGETGAGKSSIFYNMGIHAARNEPLFGVPFGLHKPLNVGIVDPENAGDWESGKGGIAGAKIGNINAGRPKNLFIHDGKKVNLSKPAHRRSLARWILKNMIHLLFLDPGIKLLGAKDENDNAEMDLRIQGITELARETSCAIVLCHHTGKSSDAGHWGRGASALLAGADSAILFRARSLEDVDDTYTGEKQERFDVCCMKITKDRPSGFGKAALYLQMDGEDRFILSNREAFENAGKRAMQGGKTSPAEIADQNIFECLMDGEERARAYIHNYVKQSPDGKSIGSNAIDERLDAGAASGKYICRTARYNAKFYRIAGKEDKPTQKTASAQTYMDPSDLDDDTIPIPKD